MRLSQANNATLYNMGKYVYMNTRWIDNIDTKKQITAKLCAYFMEYSVSDYLF